MMTKNDSWCGEIVASTVTATVGVVKLLPRL